MLPSFGISLLSWRNLLLINSSQWIRTFSWSSELEIGARCSSIPTGASVTSARFPSCSLVIATRLRPDRSSGVKLQHERQIFRTGCRNHWRCFKRGKPFQKLLPLPAVSRLTKVCTINTTWASKLATLDTFKVQWPSWTTCLVSPPVQMRACLL